MFSVLMFKRSGEPLMVASIPIASVLLCNFGCKNESSFSTDGSARSEGAAEVKSIYTINGKRIEATAHYELNADRTAVAKEKLTVGGQEVRMMQIIAAYNQMFYVFTYTASPENFERHLEEVQTIADNFSFR
jgi:hypothetical protein